MSEILTQKDSELISEYTQVANKAIFDMVLSHYKYFYGIFDKDRQHIWATSTFSDCVLGLRPIKFLNAIITKRYYCSSSSDICNIKRDLSGGFSEAESCGCILCQNIKAIEDVIEKIQNEYPCLITIERFTYYKKLPTDFTYKMAKIVDVTNGVLRGRHIQVFGMNDIIRDCHGEYDIEVWGKKNKKNKQLAINWREKEYRIQC